MRINVYSQELITDDDGAQGGAIWEIETKESNTGIRYSVVRMFLHSSDRLHLPPEDDDRSAIAFWLPKSKERREYLARTLREMAEAIEDAPSETGLD